MKSLPISIEARLIWTMASIWFGFAVMATHTVEAATNGYITAVLRSACASAPTPPPVGDTLVGTNFVIRTVADADPRDFSNARQAVTDAIFQSLMPLYCALPKNASNCVWDSVQWNIITYDVNGNPLISGCAASGCEYRSCDGFESGPPVILAEPSDQSVNSGQTVTLSVNASGADPMSYQWVFDGTNVLDGATNSALVLRAVQTNQAGTYQVGIANALGSTNSRLATLSVNPGRAAAIGYITAVLRSECANAPTPPPPVGGTLVGTNFVIRTVADADPLDFSNAQQIVTDTIFESLMPQYCGLPKNGTNCVSDSVQWNIITYDVNGKPLISGCAASGCEYRSCAGFESGPPVIIDEPSDQSVNSGQTVTLSVNASGADPMSYQWVFDGTNVLDGATNSALVLRGVQTNQAGTYQVEIANALGSTNSRLATLSVNPGRAAAVGYITAVLRSECASAPTPPPPVGGTLVGTNFVIMTVADADPLDFSNARRVVIDTIFESLMPQYCALPKNATNCVSDSVQWNIITYDVNGNPLISGCAASGCEYHSCTGANTETPAPLLKISSVSTNAALSWSTMASDFVLEASSDMVSWHPVNWPTAMNLDVMYARVSSKGTNLFFRLRHK